MKTPTWRVPPGQNDIQQGKNDSAELERAKIATYLGTHDKKRSDTNPPGPKGRSKTDFQGGGTPATDANAATARRLVTSRGGSMRRTVVRRRRPPHRRRYGGTHRPQCHLLSLSARRKRLQYQGVRYLHHPQVPSSRGPEGDHHISPLGRSDGETSRLRRDIANSVATSRLRQRHRRDIAASAERSPPLG